MKIRYVVTFITPDDAGGHLTIYHLDSYEEARKIIADTQKTTNFITATLRAESLQTDVYTCSAYTDAKKAHGDKPAPQPGDVVSIVVR